MTHQGDTTSQQPGASQPAPEPYWPSPFLAEGQSVPEAYPAPAKPGQPTYGEPDPRLWRGPQSGGRGLGFRRPAAPGGPDGPGGPGSPHQPGRPGRPGQGQASQPGIVLPGAPGAASPAAASTAASSGAASTGADLMVASAWERLLAMSFDWLLILAASFGLLYRQMTQFVEHFRAMMAVIQTVGPSAEQTALANFEKNPVNVGALAHFFMAAFALALAYFWALEATGGATLGKRVLGLRVVQAADQAKAGVKATGVRTVLFLLGPVILIFSPGIMLISLLGGGLWVADSIVLATDSQKRSLHDKAAGTLVVRKARPRSAR